MPHEHGPHWRVVCVPCAEAYWSRVPDLVCKMCGFPDVPARWCIMPDRLTVARQLAGRIGCDVASDLPPLDTRGAYRPGSGYFGHSPSPAARIVRGKGGRKVQSFSTGTTRPPLSPRRPKSFPGKRSNCIPMWTAVLLLDEAERIRLITLYLDSLTGYPVGHRSNCIEPRAIKRRPKSHRLLTKPRTAARRDKSLAGARRSY